MKKSCFKVLCMVLIIALLAPNAFAATPTPEAPLADAATVARVKQEIADGEITDMEDLLLVAYQHLGADINETDMTAYINEDGTLGITQIIGGGNSTGMVERLSTTSSVEEITFAVSTLALIDNEGSLLSTTPYYPSPQSVSETVADTSVSVVHTVFFNGRYNGDPDDYYTIWEVQVSSIVTSIVDGGGPNYVTKLIQHYLHSSMWNITEQDSKTTTGILSGSYSFVPSVRSWHDAGEMDDFNSIYTESTVYITGKTDPVVLGLQTQLYDQIPT